MLSHLLELRRRLLWIMTTFLVVCLLMYCFVSDLFQALVLPLVQVLSTHDASIATEITSSFVTPIKLAINAACLATAPFALWHIWRFVAPGLYRHEHQTMRFAMVISYLLFFAGVLFGFYLVLPFIFSFFARAVPLGVRLMPDMASAVDFITRMLLMFGLCFQIPLVCVVLVRLHLVSIARLKQIRPYIIVAAFILGMLLTPPDVLSQVMLAVPLCLLYEAGIAFCCMTRLHLVKNSTMLKPNPTGDV